MTDHYDDLETRAPEAREGALMARLPGLVAHAIGGAPGWARQLAGVDPATISSRKALAALPVLRKEELKTLQQADPPFGGLTTLPPGRMGHLYMSPGPIFDPEGARDDPWRSARALWAAGIRPGQVIQNCFGYHLTPGAWMVDLAARKLGCAVIPAGTGQTEQQIEVIRALRPDAYVGTPSFLRIIVEKALETGADISNLKRALVAAEALPPSLRGWFHAHGIPTVLQWYGTADVGLIAYESEALEGMILDEDLILEIVRPGTGEPVTDGEVGEVVVTSFNPEYPMIRFGTGDLSAVMPGPSPCGRTNLRIRGWLGRADQTTKVRGMFVHPGQVAEAVRRHPEVLRARLVITGEMAQDAMTLRCETRGAPEGLAARIAESLREVTKLRGEVELVAAGSLPNDGRVIEDARKYD
ncbi:phenylacetate--CoA ligase family protein [Quisquiliibacterium transsilvanicum]|uniref:Phenylacetate-CoA ligase n=1 Tax=Quisquiliibacterium transsilvanicum TaxID=1549638 RepID=A0A7W8M9T9_9BURK|nr:AMP-binding protein [Quisquiliibacterium transsilvanicum]MBB5273386.1 phenylacetate-CoA ligase [Quisquiliibacterium transsilvanicum]